MKRICGRILTAVLVFCFTAPLFLSLPTYASEAPLARDISSEAVKEISKDVYCSVWIQDGKPNNTATMKEGSWITLEHPEGLGSLYFIFHMEYQGYTITNHDTGEVHTLGEKGFLHEFVDLNAIFGSAPHSVTVTFPNGDALLRELYVFTTGQVPDFVQQWELPVDAKTDLVLFSAHGDDEQLFFAGLLPYYAGELGYQVQVCYLTNHRNMNPERIHEMLNGLWAVGVTSYPVFGEFDDFRIDSMSQTYSSFRSRGWSREYLLGYVVEQIRRFKPLVAVGHDIYGEYGHGQHLVYTDLLIDALEISNDPSYYPELAEKYGLWDVPKTYLHLYWENEIVMNWDRPLDRFGGMTAFEVTKYLGFPCHVSQQDGFRHFFYYTTDTASFPAYNPAEYGLFRSTVGEDILKEDMFENLTTYAEQARLEEEARLQAEAARLQAEEEARLQAEEKAKQEALEAARQAAEEARLKALKEQEAQEAAAQKAQNEARVTLAQIVLGISMLLFLGALISAHRRAKNI